MFWKIITWPWRVLRWALTARPIYFTRFGWFYVLFSLAVGAAAINTGNNLLYLMLGLLLGFIIISGVLSDSCLWGTELEFHSVGDFYAGQPAEWDVVARKNGFPGVIIQVEAFWSEGVARQLFYYIPRYGTDSQRIALTPKLRGRFTFQHLRLSTRFPFGLFEKSHRDTCEDSWIVFPKIKTLPLSLLLSSGINLADQASGRKGVGPTPFDLREYQTGDSSKRIHWKSSAKRGRWMVTEMEEESAAGQNVIVTHWPGPNELETFISFVASLVYTLYLQGQPVGLSTPGATFRPEQSRTQLKTLLGYLALVDPAKEDPLVARGRSPRGIDALAAWKRAGVVL